VKEASVREYREAFVSAFLKRYILFQIRTIRKKRGISQQQLAKDAKVTQGVVSRAEDPDYGNLTFNTVLRIAAGYDLAFVGKFVRFSEFVKTMDEMSEDSLDLPSFLEECEQESAAAVKEPRPEKTAAVPVPPATLQGLGLINSANLPNRDFYRHIEQQSEALMNWIGRYPSRSPISLQELARGPKADIPEPEAIDKAKTSRLVVNIDAWRQGALSSNPSPEKMPASATGLLSSDYNSLPKPA
jgi:transcriptional regulator with XRE-family HTH domain